MLNPALINIKEIKKVKFNCTNQPPKSYLLFYLNPLSAYFANF